MAEMPSSRTDSDFCDELDLRDSERIAALGHSVRMNISSAHGESGTFLVRRPSDSTTSKKRRSTTKAEVSTDLVRRPPELNLLSHPIHLHRQLVPKPMRRAPRRRPVQFLTPTPITSAGRREKWKNSARSIKYQTTW